MVNRRSVISSLAVMVFSFSIGVGTTVYADRADTSVELMYTLPVDEVRQLAQVVDRIKRAYVDEVDDEKLIKDAIDGMLAGLDPHSAYLTPSAYSDLQESTSGRFGGLGIEVQMDEGAVRVVSPIDDTPAFHAGVRAGDLITQLNGEPVKGLSLSEAVDIMRGEPGSEINLTIQRSGEATALELSIERAIIQVTSIRSRMLEPGYGMVRISSFQQNTGRDLANEIEKLRAENGGELSGLILDLRNNPGGLLSASVNVADAFLSEELVVYTESRMRTTNQRYQSRRATIAEDVPLIVLVNGGSASASEIVAGALQDHGRALIVGTQSFGKGSVQTVLPLEGDTALKLTTARYFTPSGKSIQASGIKPDLIVRQGRFEVDDVPLRRESDLRGHLESGTEQNEEDKAENGTEDLINQDYQLYEALNLLKGSTLIHARGPRN